MLADRATGNLRPKLSVFRLYPGSVSEQGSDSHICGLRGCLGQGTLQLRAGSQHPPVFGIGCIISHLAGRAAKSFLPATRLHQDFGPGDEAGIFCRRSKSAFGVRRAKAALSSGCKPYPATLLPPEAIGAVMEVTKWLKPSISGHNR